MDAVSPRHRSTIPQRDAPSTVPDDDQRPMTRRQTWYRRHVNGVTVLVTPGPGTWEVSLSRRSLLRRRRTELLSEGFALLSEAQDAGDRSARAVASHDCSLCAPWQVLDDGP